MAEDAGIQSARTPRADYSRQFVRQPVRRAGGESNLGSAECLQSARWLRAEALEADVRKFVSASNFEVYSGEFSMRLAELLLKYMLVMYPITGGWFSGITGLFGRAQIHPKITEAGLNQRGYRASNEDYAVTDLRYLTESGNGMVFNVMQTNGEEAVLKVLLQQEGETDQQMQLREYMTALETLFQTALYCFFQDRGVTPVPIPQVMAPVVINGTEGGYQRYGLVMEKLTADMFSILLPTRQVNLEDGEVYDVDSEEDTLGDYIGSYNEALPTNEGDVVVADIGGVPHNMYVFTTNGPHGIHAVDLTAQQYMDADVMCLLLQLMGTLGALQPLMFSHSDLRTDNVMFRILDEPFEVRDFNGKTVALTSLAVKLIDFGNSCMDLGNGQRLLPITMKYMGGGSYGEWCSLNDDAADSAMVLGNLFGLLNVLKWATVLFPRTYAFLKDLFRDKTLTFSSGLEYDDLRDGLAQPPFNGTLPPYIEMRGNAYVVDLAIAPYSITMENTELRFADEFARRSPPREFLPSALAPRMASALAAMSRTNYTAPFTK